MESLNLHIKNMVCPRCIYIVKEELIQMGAKVVQIDLGHVTVIVHGDISKDKIEEKLSEFGFELIQDKEEIIINQIKKTVREYVNNLEFKRIDELLSEYLVREIGKNYNYLSKLFSQHESITIENYCIELKIQRVKELLDYDQYNLSEIAAILCYSSVQYLSSQFRKITGLSVSEYKLKLNSYYSNYNSISEALKELRDQGYIYYFQKNEDKFECKDLQLNYNLKDLDLNEVYRFRETSSDLGKSVVYSVEANGGVKGIFVES